MNKMAVEKKKSHFEDLPEPKTYNWPKPKKCYDRNHHAPNMMVVPHGQVYVNVCPTCGHEERVIGDNSTL